MIQVNGKPMAWSKGMTVTTMLREKNYIFAKIVIKVNDVFIPVEQYETTYIEDGDDVKAIHMLAGG